ncbi:MAG: sigma-54-dependent Fis family transcriptional regulator [Elusimicrobia bacterium]|nr:sigma-54-dependent Fis family transcriptional regulator [Elusimicrobiota bacterium]
MKERILVIDDEREMLENIERVLRRADYHVATLSNPLHLEEALRKHSPHLVLTDLKMPGKDGLAVLDEIAKTLPATPVIMLTAFATFESAVAAMKKGAVDYIPKPFTNEQLMVVIEKALRERRLREENLSLRQKLGTLYGLDNFVGNSPRIRQALELVRKVASTEANILIQGESGTGKELIARILHMNSRRKDGPFVPVDCASLPQELLESELFGHEKGAFTDATASRPGIFEYANGGTIFLDEIGDMPLALQVKLLRVLQERQVRHLGSNRLIHVDVRVISATNRNLKAAVEEKAFREELFYRLNVIAVDLPPLRMREGDVALLARHFLSQFAKSSPRLIRGFSASALQMLEGYFWPGNVRELQNVIERAVALADGEFIEPNDLPESLRGRIEHRPAAPAFANSSLIYKEAKQKWLEDFDRQYLKNVLIQHGGNVSRAAQQSGIDRKTIHRMLAKYGLGRDEFHEEAPGEANGAETSGGV